MPDHFMYVAVFKNIGACPLDDECLSQCVLYEYFRQEREDDGSFSVTAAEGTFPHDYMSTLASKRQSHLRCLRQNTAIMLRGIYRRERCQCASSLALVL